MKGMSCSGINTGRSFCPDIYQELFCRGLWCFLSLLLQISVGDTSICRGQILAALAQEWLIPSCFFQTVPRLRNCDKTWETQLQHRTLLVHIVYVSLHSFVSVFWKEAQVSVPLTTWRCTAYPLQKESSGRIFRKRKVRAASYYFY